MNPAEDGISIVGLGNVGYHLLNAFNLKGVPVTHLLTSGTPPSSYQGKTVRRTQELPENQLTILCVPDDRITNLVTELPNRPLAYTSGSVRLDQLPAGNLGVFYPLQSFSKNREIDLENVPFFIEAREHELGENLYELANKLSSYVGYADSEKRRHMHIAAVWINNFTNHMVYQAELYAENHSIDPEIFKPLLKETLSKLESMSAFEAQTGPARRGDKEVLRLHTQAQSGISKEMYQIISRSILETYKSNE